MYFRHGTNTKELVDFSMIVVKVVEISNEVYRDAVDAVDAVDV